MSISQAMNKLRIRYSQDNPQALRNPWVIGWLAIIVVFLTVNALFAVMAVVSSPGLVVDDYYEQGRQYERNALKMLAAEKALQWEMNFEVPKKLKVGTPDVFRFSAVDKRGLPIKNANVSVLAYRPSDANADFVTLFEEIAPGLYQADIGFLLPGIWDIKLQITYEDIEYRMTHRITASPS